jgi:hypothetical protein
MPSKTVPIYADDDNERLYELRVAVNIAERALLEKRLNPKPTENARGGDVVTDEVAEAEAALKAAQDAYDAAVDEASERAEEWKLHSIGFEAWDDLLLKYPPRKVTEGEGDEAKEVDHPDDADFGVDTSKFGKALLLYVDPEDGEHRTVTKAGGIDLGGLARRLNRLSRGQVDTLWATAYHLNTGGIADPKVTRFSTAPSSTQS